VLRIAPIYQNDSRLLITDRLLPVNKHTRSQIMISGVRGVVLHWPDAPGWTADDLRDYLADLPRTEPGRYASYHYAVGLEGEIIRMIPESECAWHAGPSDQTEPIIERRLGGKPNWTTIGICMAHPDRSGAHLRATWRSTVMLAADVMVRHGIKRTDTIFRHHDCTGKRCPGWMTDHPADWAEFVQDVRARL
jgi:N-acetylmuramoyl-L-alanine amidase CwlA